MASIQEVSTSSKHLSFKIRVCLGRDERGKQHFKTMKWRPPEGMTPAKARKEVLRVAAVWEAEQLASADLQEVKEEEAKAEYTFGRFVDEVWIPLCVRDGSHRPSTVAMYTNILKVMRPHFEEQPLAEITGIQISKYLTWLRNDYRTNFGKPLADKSIKHHYNMLVGKPPKPSNFTKGQNAYGKQDETDYHAACSHGIRKRTHRKEDAATRNEELWSVCEEDAD